MTKIEQKTQKIWKKTTIGEIIQLEYGKGLQNYQNGVGKKEVFGTNGKIGYTNSVLYDKPSVIIGRKGAYRGVHFTSSPFFVIDTAFYTKNISKELETEFLYFWFKHININRMDSGSAIPSTSREEVYNLGILLPPLPEQRAIAAVLSSFDDKIELLREENKTLEVIAQTIYKEWFVKFNFPGATGKMVNSLLGKIPIEWRVGKLTETFDFMEGPGIRSWQYTKSGRRFMNIRLIKDGDIDINNANFISLEEATGVYKYFNLQEKDMVVSTSGTLGRAAIVRKEHLPLMLNTSVIRFRPINKLSYGYMYQFLSSPFFQNELLSMASGSVQLNFGPVHLKQIEMVIPDEKRLKVYAMAVNPLYTKIANNLSQIQTLSQIRDTLLPKLMKGEVRVK